MRIIKHETKKYDGKARYDLNWTIDEETVMTDVRLLLNECYDALFVEKDGRLSVNLENGQSFEISVKETTRPKAD